jgi:hypothetical protein
MRKALLGFYCYILVTTASISQPCLQVTSPANKTVSCGTTWTFDPVTVSTCCAGNFVLTTGVTTNALVTPISTVTNGVCPDQTITQTWSIMDGCGNSTNCSQTVTVLGCCAPCLQVTCPANKTVACGTT